MKKNLLLLITLVSYSIGIFGQTENHDPAKVSAKVFANYHANFLDSKAQQSFEITRAYFGAEKTFNENFSAKVLLDVGNPKDGGEYEMTVYLKNAYVQYNKDKFTAKFGMIGMNQFDVQEKAWGSRYIFKSFQDEYKFGSSSDLGFLANYKINDMISVDAVISNGEGYKVNQSDSLFKYGAGATLNFIKNLTLRAYYDMIGESDAQQNLALFAGYKLKNFDAGFEYNMQINHKQIANEDLNGISAYASYKIKKTRIFARFDQLGSNELEGANDAWNVAKDGQLVLAGVEFVPVKGVSIAPNFQMWSPADGSTAKSALYLNFEYKF